MKVTTCDKPECGVEIIMCRYVKPPHKPAPIEVEPSEDGNILVTGDTYEIVPKEEREMVKQRGFVLRKNHFATCEFAKSFARPKEQTVANVVRGPWR